MKDFDDLMKKVDYLVRINPLTIHPPLSQLGKPGLKSSYTPISKEKARSDLLKLGTEEIEKIYNETIQRQKEKNEKEEKGRYFNQPSYNADFNYWGKQPYWTIEEGIFLILEKDPRKIKWENISQYTNVSHFAKKFEEILGLAKRYVACGQLSNSVTPGVFLAWVIRMGFTIPEKLQEVANTIGIQIMDWQMLHKQAMELLDRKDQLTKALQTVNEKLESNLEELKKNPHQMDEESENYAPELDAANIIYRAIINNPDKNISFKKHAVNLINELYPKFSKDAKNRIATVINTTKGKNGGRERSS